MLHIERRKRAWRRYLPLFGGAIALGLIVGIGPDLWTQARPLPQVTSAIAPQTILEERPTTEDDAWASRATVTESPATTGTTVSFGLCHTGGGTNCVVDGDTIWLGGEKIRIADIDAPETHDYRCPGEKALGDRATQRLHQLVNSGTVTLEPVGERDVDGYGRKLRLVLVNGSNVGDTLVGEGLARYYEGGRRPWCS